MRKWTSGEEETLKQLYLKKPTKEIAQILGRTPRSVSYKGRRLGLKRPLLSTVVKCKSCGKEFRVFPRTIKRGGGKFCSRKCAQLARRKGIIKKCIICGREFYVSAANQRRFKMIYCSKECFGKSRRIENIIGISKIRELFETFKKSRLPIAEFCKGQGHDYNSLGRAFLRLFPLEYSDFIESRRTSLDLLYKKGRRFEYDVRNHLKEQGYFVLRSPRSLGPVDLVAIKLGEILFVQCKLHQKYLLKEKQKTLLALAKSVGAKPVLAYRDRGIKFKHLTA